MDHPAALHRLKVGVPATVEHASQSGDPQQTAQWVAETTQVRSIITSSSHYPFRAHLHLVYVVVHQLHGCHQTQNACKGSAISNASGVDYKLLEI